MSFNLTIEIFAYDVFSKFFWSCGKTKPNIVKIYSDECRKFGFNAEELDMIYYEAVFSRYLLFRTIYLKEITVEKIESLKTLSDCYDYVTEMCDRNDLFGHLTLFQRMFATSAFVVNLCECIYYETSGVIDALTFGHHFWSMYFEKFSYQFNKAGAWKELKRVAEGYDMVSWFLRLWVESENYLNEIKEATINYHKFKKTAQFYENKHVARHWIEFHINNFENYIIVPLKYQYSIDVYEGEVLLEDLNRLCYPYADNTTEVLEEYSTYNTFEKTKTVSEDRFRNDFLHEQNFGTIDTHCNEFSENLARLYNLSESSLSNTEAFPDILIDSFINLKNNERAVFETDLNKANCVSFAPNSPDRIPFPVKTVDQQFTTDIGKLPHSTALNLDHCSDFASLNMKNDLFTTKNLSSNCTERQHGIISEVIQSQKYDKDPMMYMRSTQYLNPTNKDADIANERLNINKEMDVPALNACVPNVSNFLPAASEMIGNTSPNYSILPKPFTPVNKYANTFHKREFSQNVIGDLRNGDIVNEIYHLQRMLFVLGDKQGIEYVLSTLHYPESCCNNLRENSTKRKKRHKKKTFKIC